MSVDNNSKFIPKKAVAQVLVIAICVIAETILILNGKFNGWIIAPAIMVLL